MSPPTPIFAVKGNFLRVGRWTSVHKGSRDGNATLPPWSSERFLFAYLRWPYADTGEWGEHADQMKPIIFGVSLYRRRCWGVWRYFEPKLMLFGRSVAPDFSRPLRWLERQWKSMTVGSHNHCWRYGIFQLGEVVHCVRCHKMVDDPDMAQRMVSLNYS